MLEPEIVQAVSIPFSTLDKKSRKDDTTYPVNAKLRGILQQYGFAIVTGVYDLKLFEADSYGCQELENLWGQDLLSTISAPRDDKEAKAQQNSAALQKIKQNPVYEWPMEKLPLGTKFASFYGLPHGRCAWAVRTNENVKKVFGSIYGDRDLVTGVDNVFFDNRICGESDDSKRLTNLWPHADQNLSAKGGNHEVYQGVLYIFEASTETASTVVWPGSNRDVYNCLMKSKDWSKSGHFCPLQKNRLAEFAKNARRIPVPAGGLLLWESKTIHQGWGGGGPRLAIPVSMELKALREQGAFSQKMQLCRSGQPSSHWATLALQHRLAKPNQQVVELPDDKSFRVECNAHLHLFKNGDAKDSIKPEVMDVL